MYNKLLSKKVKIAGRSVPLALIILGILAIPTAAWALFYAFSTHVGLTTAAAPAQPLTAVNGWTCWKNIIPDTNSDLTISTCAPQDTLGYNIIMSGLSADDLYVVAARTLHNGGAVPVYVRLAGSAPAHLAVSLCDTDYNLISEKLIPAGEDAEIDLLITSSGIGPGESIDISDMTLTVSGS